MRLKKQPDLSQLSQEALEAYADTLLSGSTSRPGRKRDREYPFLTERQLRSRRDKEIPMYGALLESEIGARRAKA